MASGSYRRVSDFLNYSPGLASDILAEWKSEKKRKNFPQAAMILKPAKNWFNNDNLLCLISNK